jgi:hypothetical protein
MTGDAEIAQDPCETPERRAQAVDRMTEEVERLRAIERNAYYVLEQDDTFTGHAAANFILTGGH